MTQSRLPQQAKLRLSAISADLRGAVQQEVDTLRASIDQRIGALEGLVSRQDEVFDLLVQEVSAVAVEDIDAAAAQARKQAETTAEAELWAARAQAHADIEAMRAELHATRTALETQLAQAQAAQAEATAALAEAQQEATAAHVAQEEQAVSLAEARQRIDALEEDHAQLALGRQVAEAHLEEEVQRQTTIVKQLDAAREEIRLAKAEADSSRLEAHLAAERIRTLENRQQQSEAVVLTQASTQPDVDSSAVLEHVKKGLDALSSAQKPEDMLTILVEYLGQDFVTAAVFVVGSQGFRLWMSRSSESATDIRTKTVALKGESLLARALRDCTSVSVDAAAGDAVQGLCNGPIGHAIALPVLANGHVIAVAYAENPVGHAKHRAIAGDRIAEILVDRVSQRLKKTPAVPDRPSSAQQTDTALAADLPQYALTRQARRVKISTTVEVLVDGVASALVDLSALGAQIVSPTTLRPNRPVRVVLPRDEGPLACKGRIVWARLEPPRADKPALYRAGVHFAEMDAMAVEAFATQHGLLQMSTATTVTH